MLTQSRFQTLHPRIHSVAASAITGITLLAAVALLAGCAAPQLPKDAGDNGTVSHPSSSVSASAPARAIDTSKLNACTVLPKADAETLVANQVNDPIIVSTGNVASCTYTSAHGGPLGQVEVYVGDGALNQLVIDRDNLHHAFTQPTGLGDEAWQEEGWIWARSGPNWISIRIVVMRDSSQFVTPLQTAMATALKNLAAAE